MSFTEKVESAKRKVKKISPIYQLTRANVYTPKLPSLSRLEKTVYTRAMITLNQKNGELIHQWTDTIDTVIASKIKREILLWIEETTFSPVNVTASPIYQWYYNQKTLTEEMLVLWEYMGSHYPEAWNESNDRRVLQVSTHYKNIKSLILWIYKRG